MLRAAKLFFAALILFFSVAGSLSPAFAQTPPLSIPQTAPGVPQDVNTLTQGVFFSMLSATTCTLSGINLLTPAKPCLTVDSQTGAIQYAQKNGGLLGISTHLVAATLNFPIHTAQYVGYLSSSFHVFGQKTYAASTSQGVGYAGLQPLLTLWVNFRNLAYLLMVIVFIILGFAIMLRLKIDPRTVMTLQNTIPKAVIGIILITFSFAIAALLVDLMYVITYFIINIVATAANDQALLQLNTVGDNPYGLSFSMFSGGFFGVANGVAQAVQTMGGQIISDVPLIGGVLMVLGILSSLPLGSFLCLIPSVPFIPGSGVPCQNFTLGAPIIGAIAGIIVILAVLVALWKLWIALLKAYLLILFQVTLAPFMIMAGLIPGAKLGFGSWFRGLAANLAIFPAVIGVFVLGREFANAFGGFSFLSNPNQQRYFIPPGIGNLGDTSGLAGVLAFATIMLLPSIPDLVTKTFKAESQLGKAVSQGMGAGFGLFTGGTKAAWRQLMRPEDPYRHTDQGYLRRLIMGPVDPTNQNPVDPSRINPLQQFVRKYIVRQVDPKHKNDAYNPGMQGGQKLPGTGGGQGN